MVLLIRKWAFFIFLASLFYGCETTTTGTSGELMIRVKNNSSYSMEDVTVGFPEEEIQYGDIRSGEESTFMEVTKAYRYAYIKTIVNEKELVLQPIDYVGESLLDPGLYTYELNLDEDTFHSDNYQYALTLQLTSE